MTKDKTQVKVTPREQGRLEDGGFYFDLALTSVPVKLKQADNSTKDYELRELDGQSRDKYMNLIAGKTRVNPNTGQPIGVKSFDGLQSGILCKALFDIAEDRYASEAEVNAFPNRVIDPLCDWVLEASGMNDKSGEPGNDKGAQNETDGDA